MKRTSTDRFGELLFYAVVLLVAWLAYQVTGPFIGPLAWATILALCLYPIHARLAVPLGNGRAALVTTLLAALLIVGPLAAVVSMLIRELPVVVELAQRVPSQATPERVQDIWDTIRDRVPIDMPENPSQVISRTAQSAVAFVAPRLGGAVANIASMLGSLFVMLFALFFLLRDADRAAEMVRRLLPFPVAEREALIKKTHDLVIASIGAGLTVAAAQGLLGGVSYWALGAGAPAAWGVAIGICSLIPVVGATLIWVPTAIWWALSGDILRALILTGLGAGVISMADNVLRPLLLSGRTSVNGLVVFIGLLGGTAAFGFVGLVVGPIVLVIAGTLLDFLTRRGPERFVAERPVEAPAAAAIAPPAAAPPATTGTPSSPGSPAPTSTAVSATTEAARAVTEPATPRGTPGS